MTHAFAFPTHPPSHPPKDPPQPKIKIKNTPPQTPQRTLHTHPNETHTGHTHDPNLSPHTPQTTPNPFSPRNKAQTTCSHHFLVRKRTQQKEKRREWFRTKERGEKKQVGKGKRVVLSFVATIRVAVILLLDSPLCGEGEMPFTPLNQSDRLRVVTTSSTTPP